MLSSLAPSNIKNSQLIGPPGPVNPIIVYAGPGKKSAEAQVAAARTKLDKKNAARSAKPSQVASADSSATPAQGGAGTAATTQTISAAKPDAFGPPPGRFTPPGQRALPAVADNASFMSFAPAARAEPAPLTAMPPARQTAAVPIPRPRPKTKTR
jgi:hypothetical protein